MKKKAEEIIQEIADVLAQCDGEFIEGIANNVLTHKVKYIGDDVFEQADVEKK